MAKTLFEDQLEDVFLKIITPKNRPSASPKILETFFWISTNGGPTPHYRYYFELLEGGIVLCKKDPQKEEIAYMEVMNAFIRKTQNVMVNGEPHFGIRLVKRKTYEELLSKNEQEVDRWIEVLKRFCILTKFRLHYESKQVLGKGNFAKVFRVTKKETGQEFAVKAFSKAAIMNDPMELKCLQYEIQMMRVMNHERIMKLYELYEGENFVYCLVELCRGPDLLNAIIKKGPQPEEKALTIMLQIIQALAYLHANKIIHRDLKPENIMFRHASEVIDVCVVDMGFATYEQDYTNLFVRCGTPGYVAPEILNDKEYNCKVDIFSAGVIFYLMFSKKFDEQHAFSEQLL